MGGHKGVSPLILIFVALLTITVMFIIYRPDLLEEIWLWLVGLIGPIFAVIKSGTKSIVKFIKSFENKSNHE